MQNHLITLPNGLRVIHREIPHSRVIHCGFVIDAGSRDEANDEAGIAHFIEHMVFKGTARRKTFHILNYLESVGGDVNAYTTKEKTCLYATVTPEYLDRATELLTDITFFSTFPEKEIAKERQVISEEIDMYNDNPEEAILEDFELACYPNHALGSPIAGTRESVAGIGKHQMLDFIQRTYTAGRVIFSVVGKATPKQVERIAHKYLAGLTLPTGTSRTAPPPIYVPATHSKECPGTQAHKIIGGDACSFRDDRYVPVSVLSNYIGGPANNSLLNMDIRERHGLTYNIYSFFNPYTDAGLWGVYFGCEPANMGRISKLVDKELKKLRQQKIGTTRLHQIKRQMIGQLTIGAEGLMSRMLVQAKNQLDFGRDFELEELAAQVEAITESDLLDAANFMFDTKGLSEIVFMPEED